TALRDSRVRFRGGSRGARSPRTCGPRSDALRRADMLEPMSSDNLTVVSAPGTRLLAAAALVAAVSTATGDVMSTDVVAAGTEPVAAAAFEIPPERFAA